MVSCRQRCESGGVGVVEVLIGRTQVDYTLVNVRSSQCVHMLLMSRCRVIIPVYGR